MPLVTVPFYVGRPAATPRAADDAVFDHPTPLGGSPTLPRLLDSLPRLRGSVDVAVIVAVTAGELAPAADRWAAALVAAAALPERIAVDVVGAATRERLRRAAGEAAALLDAGTYPGVRNLALALAVARDADALVLLDDDEEVRDPALLDRLTAPLAEGIDVMAGLYRERGRWVAAPPSPVGTPHPSPDLAHFDPNPPRLEAFARLVEGGAAVDAPFAFGGNMAVSRRLVDRLPFDPAVPRGEDVEFVISARLRGHRARLDPTLLIDHHPPPRTLPRWCAVEQDGVRFLTARSKQIRARAAGFSLPPGALDPYPGRVLADARLGATVRDALRALADEHVARGEIHEAGAAREAAAGLQRLERTLAETDAWAAHERWAVRWRGAVAGLRRTPAGPANPGLGD